MVLLSLNLPKDCLANTADAKGSFNNKTTFKFGISTQADADLVVVIMNFFSFAFSFSSGDTMDV